MSAPPSLRPVASPAWREEVERVYREHGHVVLRRARQILGDDASAHEVLQDVFVSLLGDPSQYAGRASLTTFLYAMTTHACFNRLRNERTRAALRARELTPRSEGVRALAEERELVRGVLQALPERIAHVAIYYFVDEMTHDEIAAIVGVSRRQVGNLVSRAQEEMRRCVQRP